MCVGDGINPAYAPDSQMCELYNEEIGYGGLFLYGQMRPTPISPLFIGFIKAEEIGLVDNSGKPKIWYYTDANDENPELLSWSRDEHQAIPLPDGDWNGEVPCDELSETSRGCETLDPPIHYPPENCAYIDGMPSFGFYPLSLALVRDGTEDQNGIERPEIVMLYKILVVLYRTAPLAAPWEMSEKQALYDYEETENCLQRADGYGNQIVHGSSDDYFHFENGELNFWHLVSSWESLNQHCCPGTTNPGGGPYGVYSRMETINWPPVEP